MARGISSGSKIGNAEKVFCELSLTGTTGSYDKQTNESVYYRITETDVREVPFIWDFTDTGTGVFGGKLRYRMIGRILRDQ